jgi:protease-4
MPRQIVKESFENFITDVTTQRVIARSDIEDGRVIRGADAVKSMSSMNSGT